MRAEDRKVDEKTLLVLDDLRLGRRDREVLGGAVAGVRDDEPDGERLGRLDFLSVRIVAVDVSLPEVVELEIGVGVDGDRGAEKRHDHLLAAVGIDVPERAADGVDGRRRGGGGARGDDRVLGSSGRTRADDAGAVYGGDPREPGRLDEEPLVDRLAVGIAEIERHLHSGEIAGAAAVVEGQFAVEGGASERGLLVEGQLDPGADAVVGGGGDGRRGRPGLLFPEVDSRAAPVAYGHTSAATNNITITTATTTATTTHTTHKVAEGGQRARHPRDRDTHDRDAYVFPWCFWGAVVQVTKSRDDVPAEAAFECRAAVQARGSDAAGDRDGDVDFTLRRQHAELDDQGRKQVFRMLRKVEAAVLGGDPSLVRNPGHDRC